jgi:hypothetical protein
VKAPGTANKTTFFPAESSVKETGLGPSEVMVVKLIEGNVSPTCIVIFSP